MSECRLCGTANDAVEDLFSVKNARIAELEAHATEREKQLSAFSKLAEHYRDLWLEGKAQLAAREQSEPIGTLRVYKIEDSEIGHEYDIVTTGLWHDLLSAMDGAKLYATPQPTPRELSDEQYATLRQAAHELQSFGLTELGDDVEVLAILLKSGTPAMERDALRLIHLFDEACCLPNHDALFHGEEMVLCVSGRVPLDNEGYREVIDAAMQANSAERKAQ